MRKLLHVFLISVLFSTLAYANAYRNIQKMSLKKDVQKKILVKYGNSIKVFKFRWTLYVNEGLVVFHSYDKIVSQNILYLNHINQSFIVHLKEKGASFRPVPYLLVKFKEFKFKNNEAVFELFLSDKRLQIQMENLKNDE